MPHTSFHDRVIESTANTLLESIEKNSGQTFSQLREYGKFLHQRTFEQALELLLDRYQIRRENGKYYLW